MVAKNSNVIKGDIASSYGEELFAQLTLFYATPQTEYPVERAKLFGFDCLRINGKVFAKLHNGQLVMKLPANRIVALIDSGQINAYEHRGRVLKEWGIVSACDDIIALAEEARAVGPISET